MPAWLLRPVSGRLVVLALAVLAALATAAVLTIPREGSVDGQPCVPNAAIGTRISENHQNVTVFQGSVVMLQPPFPVSAAAVNTSVPSVLRPVLACPDAAVAPDQPAVTFKADTPGQTWLTTSYQAVPPMAFPGYGLPVNSFDATVTVVPDPRPFVAAIVILLLVGFGVARHVRGRGRRPGHLPGPG